MGTRSITVFKDGKQETCVMYRHMDGYPSGHGQELADFLKPFTIVNGIGLDEKRKVANGFGCLVAQVIMHFKSESEVGGIYLYTKQTRDIGEEWIYTVYEDKKQQIRLKVHAGCVTAFGRAGTKQTNMPCLFDGPVAEYNAEAIETLRKGIEPPCDLEEIEAERNKS